MSRPTLAFAVFLSGCATTTLRPDPPHPVARTYGEALAVADAEAIYALELPTAHRGRDVDAQRTRIADARAELADVGRALVTADESAYRTHARVPLATGEVAVLVREADGSWRVEGGPVGAPALVSPRDAVAALRSALVRRDLRALEELLARRTRSAWDAEVTRVLEETEDPDALQIHVEGDTARVTTPDGAVIELAREADEWRVVDVRPAP